MKWNFHPIAAGGGVIPHLVIAFTPQPPVPPEPAANFSTSYSHASFNCGGGGQCAWVGEQVIQQYNTDHGTSFRFHKRAGEAPDLEYREGNRSLRIEVVTAYYDREDAKFRWLNARRRPDAPGRLSGYDCDKRLVENINAALVAKCAKSYGPNCVLAVCVLPSLTRAWEMESRLEGIRVPATNPFDAIYLCGEFPAPIGSPAELRAWKLAER